MMTKNEIMMTKNEALEKELDWLRSILTCKDCPLCKIRGEFDEVYDETINPCDVEECLIEKYKAYLEELKNLREETEDQSKVIKELLQEIDHEIP